VFNETVSFPRTDAHLKYKLDSLKIYKKWHFDFYSKFSEKKEVFEVF
jgi:hypothetical protein